MANNALNDKKGRYEIGNITIRTVDQALSDYYEKKLAITVDGGEGTRKKVPILFAGPERWKAIRDGQGVRDDKGTLILPLISIRRTNISRERGFGGMAQEQPFITVSKKLNQKTSILQSLADTRKLNGFPDNKDTQLVYEYLTLPFPEFCIIRYEIIVWAQYQNQMNEIIEKMLYRLDYGDSFVLPVAYHSLGKDPQGDSGFYFVAFLDGDANSDSNTDDFTDTERVIRYKMDLKIPVSLILSPKDEPLAYGQNKGERDSTGGPVVYKTQGVVEVQLNEKVLNLSDFDKLTS